MYSPSQLHAYYSEHFATQGFPALFMGKTFVVYIFILITLDYIINALVLAKALKNCSHLENLHTPGPRLLPVHLEENSTSAKFEKSPNIHLVRPIIQLLRIFALSD